MANLNVRLEQGIGSNLRLKQRLRHGKPCNVKANDVLSFVGDILR